MDNIEEKTQANEATNATEKKTRKRKTDEEILQDLKDREKIVNDRIAAKKRKERNHRIYQFGGLVDKHLKEKNISFETLDDYMEYISAVLVGANNTIKRIQDEKLQKDLTEARAEIEKLKSNQAPVADATQEADTGRAEQIQKELDDARAEIEQLKSNQGQSAELPEAVERWCDFMDNLERTVAPANKERVKLKWNDKHKAYFEHWDYKIRENN